MNYPEPFELHDYSYLGENFRERERIKRKKDRWRLKLQSMPALERFAILSVLQDRQFWRCWSIADPGDVAGWLPQSGENGNNMSVTKC